jgi:uncharacterized protein (TIGR02996 family)
VEVTRDADTETQLIAAITNAPDDDALYLVYGDFLQAQGDPRGQLIALHHAATTPAAKKQAESFLKRHTTVLLGALAKHKQIKLDWHLGFVRGVRVFADDGKSAIALLDEVLWTPSCRFLRKLEIAFVAGRDDYAIVDTWLAELAYPATLSELAFGKHVPSAALQAAFPLLAKPASASWEAVAKHASKRAPLAPPDVPLTDAKGHALPIDADLVHRGLHAELAKDKPFGMVARLRETCHAAQLDQLAVAYLDAATHDDATAIPWAIRIAAALGGARTAVRLGALLEPVEQAHTRVAAALDALAKLATPMADLELFVIAGGRGELKRTELADDHLERRARGAKTDASTLLARAAVSAPGYGLEARQRLLAENVIDALWRQSWTAPARVIRELFGTRAEIVWGRSEPGALGLELWDRSRRGAATPFRFVDGTTVDHAGDPVAIADDAPVAMAHPLELTRDLAAWQRLAPVQLGAIATPRDLIRRPLLDEGAFDALYQRGFHRDVYSLETMQLKTLLINQYEWGGRKFTVRADLAKRTLTSSPSPLPPAVAHAVAEDLLHAALA